MIPTLYLRSSSINNWEYCQHQCFITYTLGYSHGTNIKTEMGTCVHKVMELLAISKKNLQEGKDKLIDKELNIEIEIPELLTPYFLTSNEIDQINSTRINKDVYKTPCFLDKNHVRYGVDYVKYLIDTCYNFYKSHSIHNWAPMCYKHITNWVWMILDYKGGLYDPRKYKIHATEKHFDIEINEDWASYEYEYHGQKLKGKLRIKGTIDLTIDHGDYYEILDFKTGQKLNWATGQPKTYSSLQDDNQLLMYYYAANHIYDKDVLTSIFFVRDGGPYSICFTKDKLKKASNMLRSTFEEMKQTTIPNLLDETQKDFRCNKLCDYYKTKIEGVNTCKFIHHKLHTIGLNKVIDEYTKPGFVLGTYDNPGEV